MQDLDPLASIYETVDTLVIDQGPLMHGDDGPRILKQYWIDVVLSDSVGERRTVRANAKGLCSVATE